MTREENLNTLLELLPTCVQAGDKVGAYLVQQLLEEVTWLRDHYRYTMNMASRPPIAVPGDLIEAYESWRVKP